GIEARFIDGWLRPGFSVHTEQELCSYLDLLYQDTKFQAWAIPQEELANALKSLPFPIRFSDMLHTALSLYQKNSLTKRVWVHKCGEYYRCIKKIRQELPKAKCIFVNRDPRAVFSSQRRSFDSRTGLPMQENALHFLFGYLDTLRRLEALEDDPDFLVIQYEELLENETNVMTSIEQFLGITHSTSPGDQKNYFSAIPKSQQHLHSHVKDGQPQLARIVGWQQELPLPALLLLQTVLKKYLRAKGFPLYSPPKIGIRAWGHFAILLCLFGYEASKRKLFKIEHRY
ncbi:MAG: hypothetical protein D3923_17690, partial [Candidatus Electrothrix sp. AR3]|nr:hypothetical protein [Candidatus Electrothrix sp. AR3]